MLWLIIFGALFSLSCSRRLFPYCLLIAAQSEYLFEFEATALLTGPKVGMAAVVCGFFLWHRANWAALRNGGGILACFLFFAIFSLGWSAVPSATYIRVTSAVFLMMMYLIVLLFTKGPGDVLNFQGALVAYGIADAVIVVVKYARGITFTEDNLGGERYAGIGSNPNETAFTLALALCLVLAGALFRSEQKPWFSRKWIGQLVIAMMFIAVLLTGSRGGALAAVIGMAVLVLNARGLSADARKAILVLFSTVVVLGGVAVLFPDAFEILRGRSGMVVEDRLGGRIDIYEFYWDMLWERPFTGQGLGVAAELMGRRHGIAFAPHSTPLNVTVELGLVGLSLALGYVTWLYFRLRNAARTPDALALRLAVTAQALCATALAYGLTADILQNKGAWIVAGLAAASIDLAPYRQQPMPAAVRRPTRGFRRVA